MNNKQFFFPFSCTLVCLNHDEQKSVGFDCLPHWLCSYLEVIAVFVGHQGGLGFVVFAPLFHVLEAKCVH